MNPVILGVLTVTLTSGPISIPIEKVMVDDIWKQAIKATDIAKDTWPVQKIWMVHGRLPHSENAIASYFVGAKEIEIYIENFQEELRRINNDNKLTPDDAKAALYYVLAHEMLHHAMHCCGIPSIQHHLLMKDRGYLVTLEDWIDNNLCRSKIERAVISKWFSACLEADIEKDRKALVSK